LTDRSVGGKTSIDASEDIMKNKSLKVCMMVFAFIFISMSAFGADMPKEITLADAPFSLDRSIDTALANSRTLKESNLDYRAAGSKVKETRSQFGFNLKMTGNTQRVHDDSSLTMGSILYDPIQLADGTWVAGPVPHVQYNSFKLSKDWARGADMELTKPLFLFGKRKDAITASKKQRDQKALDMDLSRQSLVESVKEMFFNFMLMKEVVQVQEEALKQSEAHYDAAKSRFDAGAAPKFDVIRANVEVESAKENLITAKKNLDLTRMAFNNLLGFPVDRMTDVVGEGAYKVLDLDPLDFYVAVAFQNRPEIEQLALGKDLTLLSARLSRMTPAVSFQGTWTYYNRGSSFSGEHTWRLILGASLPLFDDGLSRAQISQAKRSYDKLGLMEIDLREGIILQVKQSYLGLDEARQRLDSTRAVLEMAEEAYRMAQVGFKEGVTTGIDLLDAEHGLTQARLNNAKSSFDYEIEKAKLAQACGLETVPTRADFPQVITK
jgi:outer membrane protein